MKLHLVFLNQMEHKVPDISIQLTKSFKLKVQLEWLLKWI